jgi:hypothetical protein
MTKSLRDLIEFLLGEISLCGDRGMSSKTGSVTCGSAYVLSHNLSSCLGHVEWAFSR